MENQTDQVLLERSKK